MTAKLYSAVKLGRYQLAHRVALAPMTRLRTIQPGDIPSPMMAKFYGQRASKGGFEIIEAASVSPTARSYLAAASLFHDGQMDGWKAVADAVHASIAVPGVCAPVTVGDDTYVDGGIVNPLPVDVLREAGVGRIIAVNAIPTPDRIKYCLQAERELAQLTKKSAREMVRKLIPVDEHLNYFARGNILDILMRSIHGAQICMSETLGRQADIVLRPRICDDRWLDFRSPQRFIQAGRQVTERHLPEIKALVERKTASNEATLGSVARLA